MEDFGIWKAMLQDQDINQELKGVIANIIGFSITQTKINLHPDDSGLRKRIEVVRGFQREAETITKLPV